MLAPVSEPEPAAPVKQAEVVTIPVSTILAIARTNMADCAVEEYPMSSEKMTDDILASWIAVDVSQGRCPQVFARKKGGLMIVIWSADKKVKATALEDGVDAGALQRAYKSARTELSTKEVT